MSAVGAAAAGTAKTYFYICIGLAAIGGAGMALDGSAWLAKTVGTGTGAGISSVDDGMDAFKDTMQQGGGSPVTEGDQRR